MTSKPPSVKLGAPDDGLAAATPDESADEAAGGSDESSKQASAESYDDSLEAILLQAGAQPPEPATPKFLGSKTLMGIGIEGLNLAGLRAGIARTKGGTKGGGTKGGGTKGGTKGEAKGETKGEAKGETKGETKGEAKGETKGEAKAPLTDPAATPSGGNSPPAWESKTLALPEEQQVSSLLDDVAQALNVQASEYRDRARGRLPGMPGASATAGKSAEPASLATGQMEAEFEDPDDDSMPLTPGVIAVVDAHDEVEHDLGLEAEAEEEAGEEEGLEASAGAAVPPSRSDAPRKPDSRPVVVPPVPGISIGAPSAQVGPPPGVPIRVATPPGGLPPPISARVRLPTPMPGFPARGLPSSVTGRLTLPPGTASPIGLRGPSSELTATAPSTPISLEASRRVSAGVPVIPRSGRVSAGGKARVTDPVMETASPLPAILAAQVKIATLNLAGLIALTFTGGLFVGMLVWKGQGRNEPTPPANTIAAGLAPAIAGSGPVAQPPAPSPTAQNDTTGIGPTKIAPMKIAPMQIAPMGKAAGGSAPSSAAPLPTSEAVEPPMATGDESADGVSSAKPARRPAAAVLHPPRPRRPAGPATVANAEALFPKPVAGKQPAGAASKPMSTTMASKPMATNAAPKPVAKSKTKPAWHDPFAD